MRKVAMGLAVGAAALGFSARAEEPKAGEGSKVQVQRVQGGSVRAMNKSELKELKEHKAPAAQAAGEVKDLKIKAAPAKSQ